MFFFLKKVVLEYQISIWKRMDLGHYFTCVKARILNLLRENMGAVRTFYFRLTRH